MSSSLFLYSSLLCARSSQDVVTGAEQPPHDDEVNNMIKKATGWQRTVEKSLNWLRECIPPHFSISKQHEVI